MVAGRKGDAERRIFLRPFIFLAFAPKGFAGEKEGEMESIRVFPTATARQREMANPLPFLEADLACDNWRNEKTGKSKKEVWLKVCKRCG